jgi:hypothetical protein
MKTLAASFAAAVALGAGLSALHAPAQAQGQGVMEVIVYGNDPCPRSTDAEIVVCSRRPEADRYRLPEPFRGAGPIQQRQAWVNQARTLEMVSDTGTYSCSAVGPGGHTGCLEELIRRNTGERREELDASVPPQ